MDRCQICNLGLPIGTLQFFKSNILMPMSNRYMYKSEGGPTWFLAKNCINESRETAWVSWSNDPAYHA
jgi:hypothetical protein